MSIIFNKDGWAKFYILHPIHLILLNSQISQMTINDWYQVYLVLVFLNSATL